VDFAHPFRTFYHQEAQNLATHHLLIPVRLTWIQIVKEGIKENLARGEGTKETPVVEENPKKTTDPNATTSTDPTLDVSEPLKTSGGNPSEDVLPVNDVVKTEIITPIEETKTDTSTEGLLPQNKDNSDAIMSNPPEDPIGGNENGDPTPHDGSSNTAYGDWTPVLDKRTERKNKKARKNKERQLKKQAKHMRRLAKYEPEWAQRGGVLPNSSGYTNGSPRRNSSDSNQTSQSQEFNGGGSNSNGSPKVHKPEVMTKPKRKGPITVISWIFIKAV
jgi:hypothetical protein